MLVEQILASCVTFALTNHYHNMKAKIMNAISVFHEMEIAPTAAEIYRHIDTKIDFPNFTAMLSQMAVDGELVFENNKYAKPNFAHLIDLTWNRELEIQYFTNQFRALSFFLKLLPFIKSIGISKNSFYNNSNEVFLNFIVEKGTVYSTFAIVSRLLKWFDKYSIFDTKIQFIIEENSLISSHESSAFLIEEVYEIFGRYDIQKTANSELIIFDSNKKYSLTGRAVRHVIEPYIRRYHLKNRVSNSQITPFCNIQKFIDKIIFSRKLSNLIHTT